MKSVMAHLFNMAPKAAQLGHPVEERTTQDLIMAFSVENAEVAMYESMAVTAQSVRDAETEALARKIQAQEKATGEKVFQLIGPCAADAYAKVSAGDGQKGKEAIVRHLVDAEAAERNFEDALAGFSKGGDQPEVQSLLSTMSSKAKTQHQRLGARLEELGGSRSAAKAFWRTCLRSHP